MGEKMPLEEAKDESGGCLGSFIRIGFEGTGVFCQTFSVCTFDAAFLPHATAPSAPLPSRPLFSVPCSFSCL